MDDHVATWGALASAAPDLAARGHDLLYRDEIGQGMLASVRGDGGLPRVHPVWVAIAAGRLYTFLSGPKSQDLSADGRYALHSLVAPDTLGEFSIRGRAQRVDDHARAAIAAGWYFDVNDAFTLYELSVEQALLGQRADANEWPPRYTGWAADRP